METCPAARLMMAAGMKNGEILRGPPSSRLHVLALDDVESADAGADVDADPLGVFRSDFRGRTSCIASSRGRDRQVDEAAHLLEFFFFDELERIEVLDLGGDAGRESRWRRSR